MSNLLGWGAGGMQLLEQEKREQAAMELDRIQLGLKQAEAKRLEQEQAIDSEVGAFIASGMEPSKPGEVISPDDPRVSNNPADVLREASRMYFRSGLVGRGFDILQTAGQMDKAAIDAQKAEVQERKALLELQLKQTDLVARHVVGVTSPETWEQAISEMEGSGAFSPEEIQQFRSLPYSPEAMSFLREQSISAADSARLEIARGNAESLDYERQAARNHRARMAELAEARLREQIRHNQVMEKAGGTRPANAPTVNETDLAYSVIAQEIYGGAVPEADKASADAGAIRLASRANELARDNPSIGWEEALQRALIESQQAGEWVKRDGGWFSDDGYTYERAKGKSPETPLNLPANPRDASQYKVGSYYQLGNGQVGKWTGEGFEVPND